MRIGKSDGRLWGGSSEFEMCEKEKVTAGWRKGFSWTLYLQMFSPFFHYFFPLSFFSKFPSCRVFHRPLVLPPFYFPSYWSPHLSLSISAFSPSICSPPYCLSASVLYSPAIIFITPLPSTALFILIQCFSSPVSSSSRRRHDSEEGDSHRRHKHKKSKRSKEGKEASEDMGGEQENQEAME